MTSEAALQSLLDANPADWHTRLLLGRILTASQDARGAGYTALALQNRSPFRGTTKRTGWWWSCTKAGTTSLVSSGLPNDWFERLSPNIGNEQFWPVYPNSRGELSRQQCDDSAALAFNSLSDERRYALLVPPELVSDFLSPHIASESSLSPCANEPDEAFDLIGDDAPPSADTLARIAIALLKHGDPRGRGYWALASLRRAPMASQRAPRRWMWFSRYWAEFYTSHEGAPNAVLCDRWFDKLPLTGQGEGRCAIERRILRASLDDAAKAFTLLPVPYQIELCPQLANESLLL